MRWYALAALFPLRAGLLVALFEPVQVPDDGLAGKERLAASSGVGQGSKALFDFRRQA